MILCPAIDVRGGRAVRLEQGDFSRQKVYDEDPLEAASRWVADGARFLHVVDLDGAREGRPVNIDHLRRIADSVSVPVQYGGGLRAVGDVRAALAAGADRVVLGTAAYADAAFLASALAACNARLVVSVDARGGYVATAGWTERSSLRAADAVRQLQERGVRYFVYTNVDLDGTLSGPSASEIRRISEAVQGRFLYSGGIGSLDDLRELAELRLPNLAGVIVGKALYEARFSVSEAQRILDGGSTDAERAWS